MKALTTHSLCFFVGHFLTPNYSGVLSPSFIFSWTTIANISAYFKYNALLLIAVQVKIKLGDNTLNNERLLIVHLIGFKILFTVM